MTEIETLTDRERSHLEGAGVDSALLCSEEVTLKALRIIDAQAKRIAALAGQIRQTEIALGDHGARGFACPHCSEALSICLRHGPYARTDENQCPACRRGE
jgi:hypothetical protein